MAKITYASLKLKTSTEVETFEFADKQIEVLKYLPISDKYDLIMITLQKAKTGEFYNPILVDTYFHLHLVYMYTNLTFTDKQKEDELKLYDALESSGFINEMVSHMTETEYADIWNKINEYIEDTLKYETTAAAALGKIINDLPTQAQAAMDIVNQFDPDKFSAVRDFAKAANGGREIPAQK